VSRPSHLFDLTFDLTMCPCRRPASWPPLCAAFIKEVDQHGRSAADPRDLGAPYPLRCSSRVRAQSAAGIAQMRRLERDELWLDRHPALAFCLSMIPRVEPEGMLFGKPDSTFPDHALIRASA
jgi:hypothetical protein